MSTPSDPYQPSGDQGPGGSGGPGDQGGPGGPGGRGQALSSSGSGFVSALFDFDFNSFITPKIVKFVYIIATVLVALATLGLVVSALAMMTDGGVAVVLGLIFLVAAPILGLIYLAFIRMSLELFYSVIRLSEDVHHGRGRL